MKKSEQLLHYNNAKINQEMKYFNLVGDEGDNTVIEKCDITSIFHTTLQTIEPGLSFRFQNLTACGEKNIGPLAKQLYHTHLQLMQVQRLFFHTATKFATRWTKPIFTRGIKFIRKIEHRGEDCYGIFLKLQFLRVTSRNFRIVCNFHLINDF